MLRKLAGTVILLIMTLSLLAACGDSSPTPALSTTAAAAATTNAATTAAATTSAATTNAATTAAATAAANPGQQVTLKYVTWIPDSSGTPNYNDTPLIKDFMKKYPNIKVEISVLDGVNYDKVLRPQILAGDAPDVLLMQGSTFASLLKDNILMDVAGEPGTAGTKQSTFLADYYGANGKIYGAMVSGYADDFPVYYSKAYFAKLGITPPKTIDEFLAACAKIKADGKDPLVWGGKDSWTFQLMGDPYSHALALQKVADINTALAKGDVTPGDVYGDYLNFFESLVQKGYISKSSQTLTYPQSMQYFADGKAGMVQQGTWVPSLDQVQPMKDDLGAFSFPYPKASSGKILQTGIADRSIGVSASTKHPAEAKLLYNFFLDKANLKRYLEEQSLVTLMPGIDAKVAPVLTEYQTAHLDASQYEVKMPNSKVSIPGGFFAEFYNSQINILAGSTAKDEASRLNSEFNKIKSQVTVS